MNGHSHYLCPLNLHNKLTISEQANAVQNIFRNHRFENVQLHQKSILSQCHQKLSCHLELPASTGDTDCGLISHNLGCDHGQGLTLSGVDFAGHNAASRFILWETQFTEAASRTRAQVTNVICYFHEGAGEDIESSVSFDEGIMSRQCFEL